MAKIELDGVTVVFDNAEDLELTEAADFQLANSYRVLNRNAFDSQLSPDVKVRWGSICGPIGNRHVCGYHHKDDPSGADYLFLDERLKALFLSFPYLVELVLIHEMCHLRVKGHGPDFVKELLAALEKVSWQPLLGVCAPYALQSIFPQLNIDCAAGAAQEQEQ